MKVPSASTGPKPITAPAASLTVTVLPTSPLPLRVRPSTLTASSVGASGAVVSPAITGVTADTLPALSVSVTLRVSPFFCAESRVMVKLPSAATGPVPITAPAASFTVTVLPASPLPVSARPSALTTRSVGASGAVVSPATTLFDGEVRPPALVKVTPKVSPLVCAVPRATEKLPSASTTPVPITLPAGPFTVTVLPISPLPVTVRPSALTTRPVGASGATASPTSTGVGSDTLPALSVKVTSRTVPLPCAVSRVTSKLPSAPTTAVPTGSPAAFLTVTVLPASPLPVRIRPSALTAILVGASGAVVSPATTLPTCETLPAASVRVTLRVSPLVCALSRVIEKLPSASTTPTPICPPTAFLTMTVLLISPLPVRVRPSALTAKSVGAAGAVVSPAITGVAAETLPALSVRVTSRVWPLVCAASRVISKLPSAPTGPEPITVPSAFLTVTVLPTSPLPVRVKPSALRTKPVGASGAVVSPATTLPTCETLPALSVRVTLRVSPLV